MWKSIGLRVDFQKPTMAFLVSEWVNFDPITLDTKQSHQTLHLPVKITNSVAAQLLRDFTTFYLLDTQPKKNLVLKRF